MTLFRGRLLAVSFLCLVLASCGYHHAGRGWPASKGISTIAIPVFENTTRRADIEVEFTSAIVDEFVNIVEVTGIGEADAIIRGAVTGYELTPVSFDIGDIVEEYRLGIVLSVRLVRSTDKSVLWEDKAIIDYEDFVVDQTSVAATKDSELAALRKMALDTARTIREHIIEDL